jgi:hypothetical protein
MRTRQNIIAPLHARTALGGRWAADRSRALPHDAATARAVNGVSLRTRTRTHDTNQSEQCASTEIGAIVAFVNVARYLRVLRRT